MNSEPCTDWKIDIKDPKLCRNCKKPKSDHVISKIHSACNYKYLNVKNIVNFKLWTKHSRKNLIL